MSARRRRKVKTMMNDSTTVKEFFPTPRTVIRQMVAPVAERITASTVLEPSAGKGDILDYLTDHYRVSKDNVYAIEANNEMQYVLAGKGYRVLADDFLAFDEPYHFDVVLMNPPFSAGVDHLLRAWDIVAAGGTVVALLNAETLRNAYTEKRKLLKRIVDEHGGAQELGKAFAGSARHTDVEVVLVTLRKPAAERAGYVDDMHFETDAAIDESATFSAAPLANRDMIQALVDQYNAAVRLMKERHDLNQRIDFYTRSVMPKYGAEPETTSLNEDIQRLKGYFWGYVFDRTKIGSLATSKFREEFDKLRSHNANLAFTVANVTSLLELLVANSRSIVEQCVVDVFDTATSYHEKNKIHTEGWKTNKSWKVNQKMIIPLGVEYNKWGWSFAYRRSGFYSDLDKAVAFVTGRDYDAMRKHDIAKNGNGEQAKTVEHAIRDHISGKTDKVWNEPFESEFFTIKVHKKGTVHLTFRDDDVWQRFNATAAKGKQWVGPGW